MYVYAVPEKYLEKMLRIKDETGTSIAKQIRMGIEDYILKHERSKSPFLRSLGQYHFPKKGEILETDCGKAKVVDVKFYDKVIDEMELEGMPNEEIERFAYRIEHFLRDKKKYFECDIQYKDGEMDRIDWSEYFAFKNKKAVVLRQNSRE